MGALKAQMQKAGSAPGLRKISIRSLALGELEGAAGLGLAVLLTLDHAAVAGQEAVRLQRLAQARLIVGERLGDGVTHRAGLAGKARALDSGDDVELAKAAGDDHQLGRA